MSRLSELSTGGTPADSQPSMGQLRMPRSLLTSLAATAFVVLSVLIWRLAFEFTDWAILFLVPFATVVFLGTWPSNLYPWRATLRVAVREASPLNSMLTGRLRAAVLSAIFTFLSSGLLAWQSLVGSGSELAVMTAAFILSGYLYCLAERFTLRHIHQPFARNYTASAVTWLVAVPFTLLIASNTWAWGAQPGSILHAELKEAIQIGLANLPERDGWVTSALAFPHGYEAAKLWGVVQLRDYPAAGILFSLDTALFGFVLCRTAINVTCFVRQYAIKAQS
jgi:hypothetical protein